MARYNLENLYRQFVRETAYVGQLFASPEPTIARRFPLPAGSAAMHTACIAPHRTCREMCVVRLYNSWGCFCRELIIQSAGCCAITSSGVRVPLAPGIRRRSDVLPALMASYRRRTREPYWPSPQESVDAAVRLAIGNRANVTSAIGATPSPLADIRRVRNFVAHRDEQTAQEFREVIIRLRLNPNTSPDGLLTMRVIPGITLFERWILELRATAAAAVA